jgi:hypothetical protein
MCVIGNEMRFFTVAYDLESTMEIKQEDYIME